MEASGSDQPEPLAFSYHRSIAPMMWVFVGLASTELVVVHFLLALWRYDVALVVSALTLPTLLWLLALIASFRRLPVQLMTDRLIMRIGRLRSIEVPLTRIVGIRSKWSSEDLKANGVANLALIAYPNVLLDLAEPVTTRRGAVSAVAHTLDDPASFRSALEARLLKPSDSRSGSAN